MSPLPFSLQILSIFAGVPMEAGDLTVSRDANRTTVLTAGRVTKALLVCARSAHGTT